MAICINQSGTWRRTSTLCVNQSGTWRRPLNAYINQSGTWRTVFGPPASLGASYGGGRLVCNSSGVLWIVALNSSEVTRNWYSRNDANTRAQQVSGCTGWFVPTRTQLQNPGYACRTYWDSYGAAGHVYWSSTEHIGSHNDAVWCDEAGIVRFGNVSGGLSGGRNKNCTLPVRAFRCVTY
jgi:hypothetical protein